MSYPVMQSICNALVGMQLDELTKAEKSIYDLLRAWLTVDYSNKIIKR